MMWRVIFCDPFKHEFKQFETDLQDELLAHLIILQQTGPHLGRPWVDTLTQSRHANMKEIRFTFMNRPYRFFFAFDPKRQAVVLVGGNKAGDKRFYKRFIPVADKRFDDYLLPQ